MKTVLVIGGGITGAAAMFELHKWKQANNADIRLILAESAEELGGKIRTVRENGFIMEAGADSIVTRKTLGMSFIQELGLEDQVVYNAAGKAYIYTAGELKQIPADCVFGIPSSIQSLAESTLVSAEGKVEALKDLYTANETFTKDDSIGEFLEHFLGKELVAKQIAPVLSGVYSGDLKDLTISTTFPSILQYKNEYGSIIKGLEANKAKFQSSGERRFLSFKEGLHTLIDAYEQKFENAEVWKGNRAESIEKANSGYKVTFVNGEIVEADHIILSIPHFAAKQLLSEEEVQTQLAVMKDSSLISVYIGFDVPDEILPEDGTGFISADMDGLNCNACTWSSRKWGHTSEKGNLLVRMFYKTTHPKFAEIKNLTEKHLLDLTLADIAKSLNITEQPLSYEITKWTDNMPTYTLKHPQIVQDLEKKMEQYYPGVYLAGCSYYGVSLPDCIENGEQTAKKIIGHLE